MTDPRYGEPHELAADGPAPDYLERNDLARNDLARNDLAHGEPARQEPARYGPDTRWEGSPALRQQAVRNLRRRAAFRIHLLVYLLINELLIVTWLTTGLTVGVWYPWWVFPVFGWGTGLAIHGWTAYRGDELSEDRIQAEMRRILGR